MRVGENISATSKLEIGYKNRGNSRMKQDIQYFFGCLYRRNPRHEVKKVVHGKNEKAQTVRFGLPNEFVRPVLARMQLFKGNETASDESGSCTQHPE